MASCVTKLITTVELTELTGPCWLLSWFIIAFNNILIMNFTVPSSFIVPSLRHVGSYYRYATVGRTSPNGFGQLKCQVLLEGSCAISSES